jgi:type II secretion system protein I
MGQQRERESVDARPQLRVRRSDDGFTLLEVLIAVAILAISLSSLMGSQLNSMAATRYARDISAAALLAEYQIVELEFEHRKEGWVNSDVEYEGDFGDQGYDNMDWVCTVHFIELPEYNQLIEAKEGADEAAGQDGDNVMDAGDQAFGALGMVWPIVKTAIENSIRKVDCTVSWTNGTIAEEFQVQTFWTDPNALQQLPGAGGEFSDADDDSGTEDPTDPNGSSGSTGASGSGPRTRPGLGGPSMNGGMGGKGP